MLEKGLRPPEGEKPKCVRVVIIYIYIFLYIYIVPLGNELLYPKQKQRTGK